MGARNRGDVRDSQGISLFTSLRVTEEEEVTGLDLALHGEAAYNILTSGLRSEH